jgi:predicted nuclease with TOPRIM domain
MSEQTAKPTKAGEPTPKTSRSYPEILQLNQELFKNLQALIDEDEARKKELLETKNAYEMAQAEIARLERSFASRSNENPTGRKSSTSWSRNASISWVP